MNVELLSWIMVLFGIIEETEMDAEHSLEMLDREFRHLAVGWLPMD